MHLLTLKTLNRQLRYKIQLTSIKIKEARQQKDEILWIIEDVSMITKFRIEFHHTVLNLMISFKTLSDLIVRLVLIQIQQRRAAPHENSNYLHLKEDSDKVLYQIQFLETQTMVIILVPINLNRLYSSNQTKALNNNS